MDQAALALACVLKNPNISSAITGASKPEQVFKSVKALDLLPKLTDEVKEEIEDVGEQAGATSKTPLLDIRFGTFNWTPYMDLC